jgi:serine/threonine protein kinase
MDDKNFSLGGLNTLPGNGWSGENLELLPRGIEIGGYKVISLLGAGGMGQVYLVENIQMHKQYALKILPPHLSKNNTFIDRFRVEARVMADLKHNNIVGVMNIGHDKKRELYYLVMEYIEAGENKPADLEQKLKLEKKLPEEEVLKIAKQICSALEYAHNFRGKGIVHRDLKPSNILLDSDDNYHIADFGLAKVIGSDYLKSMIDRSMQLTMAGGIGNVANMSIGDMNTIIDERQQIGDSRPKTNSQQPTATGSAGSLIGTYEYMAPEQQDGQEATVQSDIYTLGLIIYRMLTGKKAKGRFKLPSELGLSANWDEIIHKCLEIESEDRFGSVSEILPLFDFNVSEKSRKKPQKKHISNEDTKSPVKKIITLIIVLIIIAGIGLGGWYGYKIYEKKQTEKAQSERLAQIQKE